MKSGFSRDEPVFAISVVSRMVGLHQQTIRTYERVGLVQPSRSDGNTRLYSTADVERLRQVVRLVNDLGVNLAGVEVILGLLRQIEELRAELDETRGALAESQELLAKARAFVERVRDETQGGSPER
ncbi:MAG: MerR family transcriptional regulator [Chloroflexi bacterium]|nr:MerR family transcriptional regulator [Chloroflexota bacterium]